MIYRNWGSSKIKVCFRSQVRTLTCATAARSTICTRGTRRTKCSIIWIDTAWDLVRRHHNWSRSLKWGSWALRRIWMRDTTATRWSWRISSWTICSRGRAACICIPLSRWCSSICSRGPQTPATHCLICLRCTHRKHSCTHPHSSTWIIVRAPHTTTTTLCSWGTLWAKSTTNSTSWRNGRQGSAKASKTVIDWITCSLRAMRCYSECFRSSIYIFSFLKQYF